jgi:hypothetical protein
MVLLLDGREVPLVRDFESQDVENPEPQVMLLSSGEVTPFQLEMSRDGIAGKFELEASLDGKITVSQKEFD